MLRKISHIVLAPLLLTLATGLTVNLHYCNHSLYDIGIFTRAESCCMTDDYMKGKASHDHCVTEVQLKGHCKDDIITVNSVDDFLVSLSDTDFHARFTKLLPYCKTFSSGLYLRPNPSHNEEIPERDNAPPGVTLKPSFLQSFLI